LRSATHGHWQLDGISCTNAQSPNLTNRNQPHASVPCYPEYEPRRLSVPTPGEYSFGIAIGFRVVYEKQGIRRDLQPGMVMFQCLLRIPRRRQRQPMMNCLILDEKAASCLPFYPRHWLGRGQLPHPLVGPEGHDVPPHAQTNWRRHFREDSRALSRAEQPASPESPASDNRPTDLTNPREPDSTAVRLLRLHHSR